MIAVDFGTGTSLAIWGPDGYMDKKTLKKKLGFGSVKGGTTPRYEFIRYLEALLEIDEVVVESPTIGSSGCEVGDVVDVVSRSKYDLFTISARAVKNYVKDNDIKTGKSYRKYPIEEAPPAEQAETHIKEAEIIYIIATTSPERLRLWHVAEPCHRIKKSVRPMDKRGYKDEESIRLMGLLPPFESLPAELRQTLRTKDGYSRKLAIPFAQALEEEFVWARTKDEARNRFAKVIGLYDHGYPSHYRRMTVDWMQRVAKDDTGKSRIEQVTKAERKAALKKTQRQIRMLFHLCTREA